VGYESEATQFAFAFANGGGILPFEKKMGLVPLIPSDHKDPQKIFHQKNSTPLYYQPSLREAHTPASEASFRSSLICVAYTS